MQRYLYILLPHPSLAHDEADSSVYIYLASFEFHKTPALRVSSVQCGQPNVTRVVL